MNVENPDGSVNYGAYGPYSKEDEARYYEPVATAYEHMRAAFGERKALYKGIKDCARCCRWIIMP
jgi:hypothetical protein